MASNIPTRRTTRVTRAVTQKDENANAKPSRLVSRVKPSSTALAATTATGAPLTRATAATTASRAKSNENDENKLDLAAQGKRKREALGEKLVNKNKLANVPPAKETKGKGKEIVAAMKEKFDGVVIKTKATTAAPAARQPLRSVAGSTAVPRRAVTKGANVTAHVRNLEKVKQEESVVRIDRVEDNKFRKAFVHDDNAMAIDERPPAAPTVQPAASRKSHTSSHQPIQEVGPSVISRPSASRASVKIELPDEHEDRRVFKKRRTSSDAPEEEKLVEEQLKLEDDVQPALEAYLDAEPEADPEGEEWFDLDTEDGDDPLMVSEYVIDIFNYLKDIEQTTLPNPNYMENQKDLAWKMRGILIDWLIQLHVRYHLLPETLFLCTNLIDRFLSSRVVSLAKLQLVGITCLFIASKVEEIVAPSVTHFLNAADSSYTEREILLAESYILKTLDWNMSYPSPIHFLRRISKADDYDVQARTVAKYLMEIGLVEWRMLATPPSLLAAAAMWLARLIIGQDFWTPNLAHYSSYSESALIPTANLMLNYVLKPVRHEAFHKKYAAKKFYKSSIWVQDWALERWPEGTLVSLADELPTLKAHNMIRRKQAEDAAEAAAAAVVGRHPPHYHES